MFKFIAVNNDHGGHTPTPWHVDSKRALRVCAAGDETICSTGTSDSIREEWEANAAFIVKAVNLHDELVEALKEAEDILCVFRRDTGTPDTAAAREVIRAALRKAGVTT